MSDKMKLVDGQFWKDGKVVPIEIGNAEQIAILKKIEKKNEELLSGEYELELDVVKRWTGKFECICTKKIYLEFDSSYCYTSDLEDAIDNEEIMCKHCKREYSIKHDEYTDDGVIIKLLNQ